MLKVNAPVAVPETTPNGSKKPRYSTTGPALKEVLGVEKENPAVVVPGSGTVAMHDAAGLGTTVPGPPKRVDEADPSPANIKNALPLGPTVMVAEIA